MYDSYVIGYNVIHLHLWQKASSVKWLGKEKKWPPAKRNWAIFIEWLKKAKTILLPDSTNNIQRSCRKTSTGGRGDRIILRTGKLNRSQQSADPEGGGGTGSPDPPPVKSQVIWVSIRNRQLDPHPPPPWKKLDEKFGPPPEPWKMIFFFKINHLTSVK